MKKSLLLIAFVLLSFCGMAQEKSDFPFRGGKEQMMSFFKDSLTVSQEIIQKKATGLVILKFTAYANGNISKMVVYYADDAVLIQPIVDAIKKSNQKWLLPDGERFRDFIITFSYNFNTPPATNNELQKAVYDYMSTRRPIILNNQSEVDNGILLPTVVVNYDVY
jgi:hypothetical protein